MGNSLRVVVDNYIGSVPFPCHLQLGPSASIDLSRNFEGPTDEIILLFYCEAWNVTYTVDEKRCQVQLLSSNDSQFFELALVSCVLSDSLSGTTNVMIDMMITDSNYIKISPPSWSTEKDSILWTKINTSFDANGGVMHTKVDLYGSGGRWGLVVMESKRNKMEEDAEVVTVAHYIVKSSERSFYRSTGTNIGLSVMAKFRTSNGKFEITVEGPEQHPVFALLYMFDEVKRTGIWKPTMCPHCNHKRKGKLFWQSDSEDSDSVYMPLPRATRKMQEGSPMVEGSVAMVMVISLKTMLWFSKDDNSYSTQDKTSQSREKICVFFLLVDKNLSMVGYYAESKCNILLLALFIFFLNNKFVIIFIAVTIYNYYAYPVL